MLISIKVKTNAKKNEVICVGDNIFEVRTTTSPEKGKANRHVIELLSKYFKVSRSGISIIRGVNSHNKVVDVQK